MKKMAKKITTGTKEWADHNINLIDGCSHDCKYCYAKKMAIRFKRKTSESWHEMKVRQHEVDKKRHKYNGRVMFPTSHDLVPDLKCFTASMIVLEKLLESRNEVLVTTKPHLQVIIHICKEFIKFKEQIQFRFTITSKDDKILSYWEPKAPSFSERLKCLKFAHDSGYKTSISIEPCLDPDPRNLIDELKPFVTGSIWLGSMNYSGKHEFNSNETLSNWSNWFRHDKKIKFKDTVLRKLKHGNK